MRKQLYAAIVAAFLLTAGFLAPMTAQAHSGVSVSPLVNCGTIDWWTDEDAGTSQLYPLGIRIHTTMEASHDANTGAYCGTLRAKNTITRAAGDCNNYIVAALFDHTGVIQSVGLTWTGCGEPNGAYALYTQATQSSGHVCPFYAEGEVIDHNSHTDFQFTNSTCSL